MMILCSLLYTFILYRLHLPLACLSSLLPFLKTKKINQQEQVAKIFQMKTSKCNTVYRNGTLKNQPNKMGMTPQHIHTIPTYCAILPTMHTKNSLHALSLFTPTKWSMALSTAHSSFPHTNPYLQRSQHNFQFLSYRTDPIYTAHAQFLHTR